MNSHSKVILAEHHLATPRTLTSSEAPPRASAHSFETTLQIPSCVAFITPAVERIVRKLRKARCIPGKEPDLRAALYEAMANAVIHGNRQDAKKQVHVRCRYDSGDCVRIVVSDEGPGFDPNAVPDPTLPENLQSEHGRGIFLMKTFMDEVRFEKNGAEVHLIKRSSGPMVNLLRSFAFSFARYFHSHLPHLRK